MEGVKVTPKEQPADNRLPDSSVSLEILPIKSFLSIEGELDPKETEQLEYIKSVFGKDVPMGDILSQIREIERKLGVPRLGESRLGKIYNYMRAMQNVKQAEKIRDSYLA